MVKRLLFSLAGGLVLGLTLTTQSNAQGSLCGGLCPFIGACDFIGCNITQYEKDPITGKVTPVSAECIYFCDNAGIQPFLP